MAKRTLASLSTEEAGITSLDGRQSLQMSSPLLREFGGVVDDLCTSVREIASEQNAIGAYEAKQARQDIWIDRECSVEVKPLEFS